MFFSKVVLLMIKHVTITELNATMKGDNLILDAKFKLKPSRRIFSRIKADLYFDGHHLKSFYLGIPYYFARREEFPLRSILSLEEISAGRHTIKLEMLGLWPSAGPSDIKEATVEYQPFVKPPMARAIPIIKKIEGPKIAVVTDEAKKLYQEMKERWKKELVARRERW